ncbi:MAG: NADP-dependent phosphogluconate dehydrogenase [Nanoarchaeota archaeon]|nr:NADP-dependent phosphogluconate dehydrogenase [Nanoarchaeota archaeon]
MAEHHFKFIEKGNLGLIGLGVMGQNLVLNLESRGFSVAVYNRTVSDTEAFIAGKAKGKKILGAKTLEEFAKKLETPRKILLMVTAGDPVDAVINQLLLHLSEGDIVIDGGNSFFKDTIRRTKALVEKKIHFIGMGISGGEKGALIGPSIMAGGSEYSWKHIKPLFETIAAKAFDGSPCCAHIGGDGAGHYVKMVHNGIEYADMQLIGEAYQLLKEGAGLTNEEMSDIFAEWNKGELNSYLIEITSAILKKKDEEIGKYIIDLILDEAGQKGTGKWASQSSLDIGVPAYNLNMAVLLRYMSTSNKERESASKMLSGPKIKTRKDKETFAKEVHDALYASKLCAYAQGFSLMAAASKEHGWNLNFPEIARIWEGGCIIRAELLENIRSAFSGNQNISNLLLDVHFREKISDLQSNWRKLIAFAVENGIPATGISSACAYYDSYRCARLPTNLIQAQRDFFGAHTYKRIDKEGSFHTEWEPKEGDDSAKYKLGVVGTGHWVRRLHPSIKKSNKLLLHKGAGVTRFEDKKAVLDEYNITKDRYFQIPSVAELPLEFFKDLDAVQIASYNQFHHEQTKQSLAHGKVTVVEKTFATERKGFDDMIDFIKKNGHEKKVYPHLHYLSKALTRSLAEILPEALKNYGKITCAAGTFVEETREEDMRRTWLLKPENGGIFLDWIHPVEVLAKFCGANFLECKSIEPYIVNPAYDTVNPTGLCARFKISGSAFTKDAFATIRVGKGFPAGVTYKSLRLFFEKSVVLDLNYISSEEEFQTGLRGAWELAELDGDKKTVLKKGTPEGPLSYDFLVKNMLNMIDGKEPPLSIDEIKRIYEPVWQVQEAAKGLVSISEKKSVEQFIKDALEKAK